MKILLAVFSCHRYIYRPDDWFKRPIVDRVSALRDTWLKDVTVDYKIFRGRRAGIHDTAVRIVPDEVFLNVPDDYEHSNEKIKAIIAYAYERGYNYIVKVDDDVYVYWDRLITAVPTADYAGGGGPHYRNGQYCAGITYWLSRRAMEVLLATSLATSDTNAWAEDRWVGTSLWKKQIRCQFDDRYYVAKQTRDCQYISDEELAQPNDYLTIHSLSPNQMRSYHANRDRSGHAPRNH